MANLDFLQEEIVQDAKRRMQEQFARKRSYGTLSLVHAEDHCEADAIYGGVIARAVADGQGYNDLSERASTLTAVAGYLHDYHREAKETEPHAPHSAAFVRELYRGDSLWGELGPEEYDAIYRAILNHESNFTQLEKALGDPIKGLKQQILPALVGLSLLAADSCPERSGYRVLERRAFFMKERQKKDVRMFKIPDESHLAVLGETLRRLYTQNPVAKYPVWLREFGQKMHAIQYQLLTGLSALTGMTETEAAMFMKKKGFPRYDEEGILEIVEEQRHLEGGFFLSDEFPILVKEIERLQGLSASELEDLSASCAELIKTFATSESPEKALETLSSRETKYSNLKRFTYGMIGYRQGTGEIVDLLEKSVRESVEKLSAGS